MTNIMSEAGKNDIVAYIRKKVSEELVNTYPDLKADPDSFTATLINAVELTGNKFVTIIDEDEEPQTVYIPNEELPAGDGYADIVYLPKKDSPLPALVIELKWNKSAKGAIAQIKNNHYPDAIKGLGCDILLVGINYDKDAPAGKRKHECVIERLDIK